jgi:dihydroflavonol-4-reductase
MKVLVTGANGFVGASLCRALAQEGHEVLALVRRGSDRSELEGVPAQIVDGDVTDPGSLARTFVGVDSVFHLAGVIAYRKADRALMERVNVEGTAHVLKACREAGVRRLVHMSSVTAIGAGFKPTQVLNEGSSYNIAHLDLGYFETKRQAEELVRSAVAIDGVDAVIVNPSTIYGPGDARKGSRKTQLKVAQGRFPFYTGGGVSIVALDDAISGIIAAWKKGRKGERYILAGDNILIKELFALIAEAAGVKAPGLKIPDAVLFALGRWGDLKAALGLKSSVSVENAWSSTLYHWFDHSKARAELDFRPRPAREAIASSVAWMRENGLLDKNP